MIGHSRVQPYLPGEEQRPESRERQKPSLDLNTNEITNIHRSLLSNPISYFGNENKPGASLVIRWFSITKVNCRIYLLINQLLKFTP